MTENRISRDAALERIRHHIHESPPPDRETPLFESLGLICAHDLFAVRAMPTEPRSRVDGYALASMDTRFATREAPARLSVAGLITPGDRGVARLVPGQAAGILTGGQLPPGADCVVPREETEPVGEDALRIFAEAAPMDNVRPVGGDLKAGTRIVRRGEELTPTVLSTLAVSGVSHAKTFVPPRVRVLAIGNELASLSAPHVPGKTPADNLVQAAGLLRCRGVTDLVSDICGDDLDAIAAQLAQSDADCIVTTGGTGPGQRDYVRQAAAVAGFSPLFDGVALSPGRSMFAASKGRRLLFALPGTPPAVFVLMHAIVLPAMCWLRGRTLPVPSPILTRPTETPRPAPLGWERLVACTNSAIGAELQARPLLDRSREGRLDMLQAQGLLIVSDKVENGDLLPMIPIWENGRGLRLG